MSSGPAGWSTVPAMTSVIHAQAVSKWWGQIPALSDVTVTVDEGVTGLLGANGAGKTTLLGLVLGLHAPDGGRLEVLGHDPATAGPAVRRRLGYSPEHDALPGEARAQDLVRHVAELHGLPPRFALSRASETLDLTGLGEERLREIGSMSVGQRQRVKIAQAIAHDPDLVLLDEPTNGLDPLQRGEMLTTIRRIGHDLGITVVVSSHLIHEVEQICDAVVVLDAGRVTAAGSVAGMIQSGGQVLVEVDGGLAPLRAALTRSGLEVTGADVDGRGDGGDRPGRMGPGGTSERPPGGAGRLLVTVEDEEELDLIRDAVAELGLGLRRLTPRRTGLAERFFPAPPPPPRS